MQIDISENKRQILIVSFLSLGFDSSMIRYKSKDKMIKYAQYAHGISMHKEINTPRIISTIDEFLIKKLNSHSFKYDFEFKNQYINESVEILHEGLVESKYIMDSVKLEVIRI